MRNNKRISHTGDRRGRVTVTVDAALLRRLDAAAGRNESRSRAVEEAIRLWLEERTRRDLDRATEEYYRSLAPTDRDEDRSWGRLAADSAKVTWKD